jgi:hypothetical protein
LSSPCTTTLFNPRDWFPGVEKEPWSDDEFYRRYEAYDREALEEYLRQSRSEAELRDLLTFLIDHRQLMRESELTRLREESEQLVERLHETSHRKLLAEIECFKDILALQKRLLELDGGSEG